MIKKRAGALLDLHIGYISHTKVKPGVLSLRRQKKQQFPEKKKKKKKKGDKKIINSTKRKKKECQ